ncbi:bifunctional diguanylate cyclase/phosphodiesterase [Qipengyuania sediminis]|uniref:bifunctional diguanylate cyclase/phosphodiesterase n=1 Tax=Qipengyuania sediminis TaxID=1532023 RepID=UPI001F0FE7A1|nr:bifunctional diguanylate cyclase/phosphodiesterase [Qipengyuania sediminis]
MIALEAGVGGEMDERRDPLTGLLDAGQAKAMIARWLGEWRSGEGGDPFHAMLITAGRIDTVNLAFGATTGDGALVEIARRMMHFAADEFETADWFAARVAGGTFLLVARDTCSRERWQWFAEALADAISMPIISAQDGGGTVRLWPRVALMRAVEGDEPDRILDQLATALHRAREERGRRVVWVSGELAHVAVSNQQLEADMLAAIDRGEIEIVFQPQYAFPDDRLVGAEALARWQHPEIGRLGANTLFTLAERTDHVAQLSRHIAERALELAGDWPAAMQLSVNVTPADLAAATFPVEFLAMVDRAGFAPTRITIEITEEVLLADLGEVTAALAPLKAAGVTIALDDFGAGYSNFRYLKLLPIDKLKLDRSMVEGIAEDERDLAVLRAITAMARALGLAVVAEGVENEDQHRVLGDEGIESYQGFYKSVPLAQENFLALTAAG